MILTELTATPVSALPVAAFRDHLRLGTGFADDTLQDPVLEPALRAAIAAIEGRTAKALFSRSFTWRLEAWRDLARQVLPMAPVPVVSALKITDLAGVATVIDPALYRLVPDTHRPALASTGLILPQIPVGGWVEIDFDAGFGPAWTNVPADLQQAVLTLAADRYENRDGGADWPPAVAPLIARHRDLRLFGGRR